MMRNFLAVLAAGVLLFAALPVSVRAGELVNSPDRSAKPVIAEPSLLPSASPATDGVAFPISHFNISYKRPSPDLPSTSTLMNLEIELGWTADGFVVPEDLDRRWNELLIGATQKLPANFVVRKTPTYRVRLRDIQGKPQKYYTSAIWAVGQQITSYFTARHIIGVFVQPAENEIRQTARGGEDLRDPAHSGLDLVISTGHVTQIRSIASGTRINVENRINAREHEFIRENSPVQPNGGNNTTDVLHRDMLDDYIFFLNRAPGRHVDIAVSAASALDPGDVVLDYLVTETKPWTLFAQVSNTGTRQTNVWRERIGYIDNQLTNHDDILTVDYTTASIEDSNDVSLSYERPLTHSEKLRIRGYGDYNQYTASDVGASGNFRGEQYSFGAELVLNLFQFHELFIDAVGGAKFEHDYVRTGTTASISGSADYGVPYLGLKLDRTTDTSTMLGDLTLVGRLSDVSGANLNNLGRTDIDSSAIVLQGDYILSFFLEPLLDPDLFAAAKSTLAHEVALSMRGQYAFGYRLLPTAEQTVGGMFSVRGYPESVSSGDNVIVGSAEYRYHVPRGFAVNPTPNPKYKLFSDQPFKFSPQQPYGRPDWDLILKAFLDAGWSFNNNPQGGDHNDSLVGTGVGFEFDLEQYLSIRVDYGVALTHIPGETTPGDSRIHFMATVLY